MKKFILLLIGLGVLGVGVWIGLDVYTFNLKKEKEDALLVGKLIRQLRDEKPLRRGRAALDLGKMGPRSAKAVPALIGILDDEAKLERTLNRRRTGWRTSPGREAAFALAKIGAPAIGPLLSALKDSKSVVRANAALGLGEMLKEWRKYGARVKKQKEQPLLEGLSAALKDPASGVRRRAVEFLPPRLDWMMAAIRDKDASVRADAVKKLGIHVGNMERGPGEEPAVLALIDALRDKSPGVRSSAAYVLRIVRDPRSVAPLIAALKDKFPEVVRNTAWALREIGDVRAIGPLISLLSRMDNPLYGPNHFGYLRALTGKNFGEDPEKWRKWWKETKGGDIRK